MLKKIAVIALISVGFAQNSAAYESSGFLKDLFVSKEGLVLFRLSNPVNQRPQCATNSDWDYQLDLTQPNSAHLFKLLQMSERANKPLTVGYGPEIVCGKRVAAIAVDYVLFKNLSQQKKQTKGNYATKK